MFALIERIFEKIVRIIKYIPIIWKNEDNDYTSIFKLLEYKLSRIESNIDSSKRGDRLKISRQVKLCRLILARLGAEAYCIRDYDVYYSYWDDIPENVSEEYRKEAMEEWERIVEKEDKYIVRDLERLFRVFGKYYRLWISW